MAKAHSGGPGTYNSGQVNCTMDPPFKAAKNQPAGNHLPKPFDGGASSAPFNQRVTDNIGGSRQSPSQVAPSQQGQKREGTKEYPYGGGGMRDGKAKR